MSTEVFVWTGQEDSIVLNKKLTSEGEELKILGVLVGDKQDFLNLEASIVHEAPGTHSNFIMRGILKENASVLSDNLIRINKGAKGAKAFLSAKILLFDQAKGVVTPSLEIDENQVKAAHAASVGQINEEELFYLQSRGLSRKEATDLIIEGFFAPLIKEFDLKEQENLRKKIREKLC